MNRSVRRALVLLLLPAGAAQGRELQGDVLPGNCTSSAPATLRAPAVGYPLYAGQDVIRIYDQTNGATIDIEVNAVVDTSAAAKNGAEFTLTGGALAAGDLVQACQDDGAAVLCGAQVEVLPQPASLGAPLAPHAVHEGAAAVTVASVHPGAEVVVSVAGVEIGRKWANSRTAVSVPIDDTLAAGTVLDIHQEIAGLSSATRSFAIQAGAPTVVGPRVLGPVRDGDLAVWISGVTPGSVVEIVDDATGAVVGAAPVGEPIAKIPVCGVTGDVFARATRDGVSVDGGVEAMTSWTTPFAPFETDFAWGTTTLSDGSVVDMRGFVQQPTAAMIFQPARPAVFVIHGAHYNCQMDADLFDHDSEMGYQGILQDLVSEDLYVFSIHVDDYMMSSALRAELLLDVVAEADSRYGDIDANSPIAFVGHSLGGEAVILARGDAAAPANLKGVVAIAPTSYGIAAGTYDPSAGTPAPLLHLYGSQDHFHDGGLWDPDLESLTQYDNAWFARTGIVIDGAGHYEFNECWAPHNDDGTLTMEEHQAIAKAFVLPFLVDRLNGLGGAFLPFFQGTVRPIGTNDYTVRIEHHYPNGTTVVDTFGDAPDEMSFPSTNVDPAVNAQGGAVTEVNPPAASTVQEGTHTDFETTLGVTYSRLHDGGHYAAAIGFDSRQYEYVSALPAPVSVGTTDVVSLRVMPIAGATANDLDGEEGWPSDFMVGISDGTVVARVRAGSTAEIHYPYADTWVDVQAFQTVRIPIDAFLAVEPTLNLANITEVRIQSRVRETGRLIIDDLEIGP